MIKTEYVCTNISLRKLARKYGVCNSKIFARCRKENWVLHREIFRYHILNEAKKECGLPYDENCQEFWEYTLSCL